MAPPVPPTTGRERCLRQHARRTRNGEASWLAAMVPGMVDSVVVGPAHRWERSSERA